ncbi:hypothetical protein CSUB01_02916 [Colletotrichum sublineola]|uniref:Uncharacterized protein n=1 Tax=Colletotrichum sublineola TaxID=1173701 RepID=A0A066X5Y2_COLSU|nr:hypothetical protein CSUB01_02916 [Colletotrichum sublineola]
MLLKHGKGLLGLVGTPRGNPSGCKMPTHRDGLVSGDEHCLIHRIWHLGDDLILEIGMQRSTAPTWGGKRTPGKPQASVQTDPASSGWEKDVTSPGRISGSASHVCTLPSAAPSAINISRTGALGALI